MRLVFLLLLLMPFLMSAQDHLLITEIQTEPADSSFIEIYNPTLNSISLDSIYIADYNTYYQVTESIFTDINQNFIAKFPIGSSIASKSALVIALNGYAYETKHGAAPDYEIHSTSVNAPDMYPLFVGSGAAFSVHEMLILFKWDGNSDLVQDLDYIAWGRFTSKFIDKSGLRIDGPDSNSDSSQYLSDTPVESQLALDDNLVSNEVQSMQRIGITEGNETTSGGNGLTGHDETSEDLTNQFTLANPTPGVVQEVPGDGSGTVTVSPDSIEISNSSNFDFIFAGEAAYTLDKVQITIPANWSWSGQASDVSISGTGFTGSTFSVNGNDILIENTVVTTTETGTITVQNLTAPAARENSVFTSKTSVVGGNLSEIQNSPKVAVWTVITIADIQNDPSFIGTVVSLEAFVTLGSGIIATDWTDAYIQDNSGRGINVYRSGTPLDPNLVRKNKIQITGTVDEYGGVTEIVDYVLQVLSTNQPLPTPTTLSTLAAHDLTFEGTYIETKGVITDKYTAGGGTTIRIDDGSGEIDIRAWDSANLNLGAYNIGDIIAVKGIMDVYQSTAQILLSYQDDIDFTTLVILGDGSGIVTISEDTIAVGDSLDLFFDIIGNSTDTVTTITLEIPNDWNWGGNYNISGTPFSSAGAALIGNLLTISNAQLMEKDTAKIELLGLKSPSIGKLSTFYFQTATDNGTLTNISVQPVITVISSAGTGTVLVSPDSVGVDETTDFSFMFEGTSLGIISNIEIDIPTYWNWSGNLTDVSTSGLSFSSSNISINSNTIIISDAELTSQLQGEIILRNLTSPTVDTSSHFLIKTGDVSSLENIDDQPIIMVGKGTQKTITPIDSIQMDPSWEGKIVTVKAVVSIGAGILRTDFTDCYVQDTTGYGLNVYRSGSLDPNLVRGNYFLITGEIVEFRGVTEITNYTLQLIRKNSNVLGIKELTTFAAKTDTSLEGSFVKVSGKVVDVYRAGDGTNIIIDDGSRSEGESELFLRIWDSAQLDVSGFSEGDGIVAYGVLDIYNSEGQVMIGYQQDIQHIVLPIVPQFLQLPNKPFVPDRGEVLAIRYSAGSENTQTTMRIYDLSGRLVTTLIDGSGRSFEQIKTWNGTDQLNDLVPLGTYILHYEVVNNSTGKRWQKAAPIVVGTVLK